MKKKLFAGLAAVAAAAVCGVALASELLINGAGATFPYPIYSKWFDTYAALHKDVRFNYQSIGSGGGVKQIIAETVDFGASDGPMSDSELEKAPARIIHIPTVMGAVAVAYNLGDIASGLKLTSEALVDIYLGNITKWNDPKIAQANPGVNLPDQEIITVHRSDGSGTTYIFTDYLSSVSTAWKMKVGTGKSAKWPNGLGGKGNEGVAGVIKQTLGTIGYIELSYAQLNNLPYASIQNQAGNFVAPSMESTVAAMAGAKVPSDYRLSIVDQPGQDAYPIAGLTWILIYKNQKDEAKGKAMVKFLWWALHEGQDYAGTLGYSPLPNNVVEMLEDTLLSLKHKGKPLLERPVSH